MLVRSTVDVPATWFTRPPVVGDHIDLRGVMVVPEEFQHPLVVARVCHAPPVEDGFPKLLAIVAVDGQWGIDAPPR